jgi:hypothetical protein
MALDMQGRRPAERRDQFSERRDACGQRPRRATFLMDGKDDGV